MLRSPIPPPALRTIFAPDSVSKPTQWPTSKVAREKVKRVLSFMRQFGIDPHTSDAVVDCDSIKGHAFRSCTPCLTASRACGGGFWSVEQRRLMQVAELLQLQGMSPMRVDTRVVAEKELLHMIGSGFTQTVIMRLFAKMLPLARIVDGVVDPYVSESVLRE